AERRLTVSDWPELELLPTRSGGIWQEDSEHHEHADLDPHLWLDAGNAVRIIEGITDRLAKLDPAHAETYRQNAASGIERIKAADAAVSRQLQTAKPKPYWVLHDTLQYFEHRYGLNPAGTIMVSPERKPGAKRMLALRAQLRTQGIACILYEPRYGRRWIDIMIEGSAAQAIPIDPLGLEIESGGYNYEKLLLNLAAQLAACK
ncbi:MAG TPA: zinc ABC transporter substrate-binding protein, partial [Gammaproteobacteria bacterium]